MEQKHFEILLENMHGDIKLVAEGVGQLSQRVDNLTEAVGGLTERVAAVETRLDGVETRLENIEVDVREIKQGMGVLTSICSNHESRLQTVEYTLRDHLAGHS